MPFPKLSDYLQITPNELVFSKSKNFTCIVKLKKLVESQMWFHHLPHDGFDVICENDGIIRSEEMQVLLAFPPIPLQENFPSTMKIGVVSIDCYSFPIELPVKFSQEMEALDCDICKKVYKPHAPKFVCKNETCTTERNEVCCSCLFETHGIHRYGTILKKLENNEETVNDVLSMLNTKKQDIQQKLKSGETEIGKYKKEMRHDLKLIRFLKYCTERALKNAWLFLLADQLSTEATKLCQKEYGNGSIDMQNSSEQKTIREAEEGLSKQNHQVMAAPLYDEVAEIEALSDQSHQVIAASLYDEVAELENWNITPESEIEARMKEIAQTERSDQTFAETEAPSSQLTANELDLLVSMHFGDLIDLRSTDDTTSLDVHLSEASEDEQTDTLVSFQTFQSNTAPINEANQSEQNERQILADAVRTTTSENQPDESSVVQESNEQSHDAVEQDVQGIIARLNASKQKVITFKMPTKCKKLTQETNDDKLDCSTENVVEHDQLAVSRTTEVTTDHVPCDGTEIGKYSYTDDSQQNRVSITSSDSQFLDEPTFVRSYNSPDAPTPAPRASLRRRNSNRRPGSSIFPKPLEEALELQEPSY